MYTNDDPVMARRLEAIGCVSVMPLAAPIGSGLGICNPWNILTILEDAKVPIVVDAGVGTGIGRRRRDGARLRRSADEHRDRGGRKPVLMASAMKHAVVAGREAFRAGRMPRRRFASASSPVDGAIA